jgi:hypothetical protein
MHQRHPRHVGAAGRGGNADTNHHNATTYPIDNGFWVAGATGVPLSQGGSPHGQGYKIAFRAGQGAANTAGSPWGIPWSHIGIGLQVDDYATYGVYIRSQSSGVTNGQAIRTERDAGASYFRGGLALGAGTATATGSPKTGAPVDADFSVAADGLIALDMTGNGKLWCRVNGAWRGIALA